MFCELEQSITCKRYFTCFTSYNVTKHFFVRVISQKSALAIWGMKASLCFMYGNKARVKTAQHFYTVFWVCDSLFVLFSIL